MIRDNQKNSHSGFTLVELLLSMAFISLLLIAIAMLVIQIGNIYSRGVTMKEVNQAGRAISSDLQSSIAQSPRFNPNDLGGNYVVQQEGGKVIGMRLCLGGHSYIWNNGTAISGSSPGPNLYGGGETGVIRFVKATDSDLTYCKTDPDSGAYPNIDKSSSTELLNIGENDLSIYKFEINSNEAVNDDKIGQRLYNINFTLGTGVGSLDEISWSCRPPDDTASDVNYCSINDFSLVVRAGDQIE